MPTLPNARQFLYSLRPSAMAPLKTKWHSNKCVLQMQWEMFPWCLRKRTNDRCLVIWLLHRQLGTEFFVCVCSGSMTLSIPHCLQAAKKGKGCRGERWNGCLACTSLPTRCSEIISYWEKQTLSLQPQSNPLRNWMHRENLYYTIL